MYESLLLIKLHASFLLRKRSWHWCFPVSFANIFENKFFTEHFEATASVHATKVRKIVLLVAQIY